MPRYWVITASRDHVAIGRRGGFCQACHGKRAPLVRMQPGDGVVFYSPRTSMAGGEPVQAFTAIGTVARGEVRQVTMAPGFHPFRRDVRFHTPVREVKMAPLAVRLSFVKSPRFWGYPFRRGHFEISAEDFALIAAEMQVDVRAAAPRGEGRTGDLRRAERPKASRLRAAR